MAPGIAERNYAKEPLTAAEIRGIVKAAGGVGAVINTRRAKDLGWETPPDVETFVAAAVGEPNLLKRPILVRDGAAVVGKNEAGWKALLA